MSTSGGTSGGGSLTYVQGYLTTAKTLVGGIQTEIMSVDLAAGTWIITANIGLLYANTTIAIADVWLGDESASDASVWVACSADTGLGGGGNRDAYRSLIVVQELAAATTAYLNAYSAGTPQVTITTDELGIGPTTGISAVKIA